MIIEHNVMRMRNPFGSTSWSGVTNKVNFHAAKQSVQELLDNPSSGLDNEERRALNERKVHIEMMETDRSLKGANFGKHTYDCLKAYGMSVLAEEEDKRCKKRNRFVLGADRNSGCKVL